MRPSIAAALCLLLLPAGCESTDGASVGEIFSEVEKRFPGATTSAGETSLSTLEIDQGLREALRVGVNLTAQTLGRTDGYFGDPQVRIPLPGRLGELQSNLKSVGLSQPLDDLELRMNRAAEDAVPEAKRLVLGAVQSITLEDALGILRGGDTAATDYLRGRTEDSLRNAFRPHVESTLSASGAFTALNSVTAQYGLSSVSDGLRRDLTTHAVNLGLDGLFLYVAAEEKKIREEPVARTSEILRRVFGSAA
ncbi:MAG: DUF4197 domain-containing protein [Pseudomonadota bacterium]